MKGTVYQTATGWAYRIDVGKDLLTGKRKQKRFPGFRTREDAQQALNQTIKRLEKGKEILLCTTVGEYLDHWYKTKCISQRYAESTIKSYGVNIYKHTIPYIGNIHIPNLDSSDIDDLYDILYLKGLNGTSVKYVHATLRKAFNDAIKKKLFAENPFNEVEIPKTATYIARALTASEVKDLLLAIMDSELFLPVFLGVSLGLRRGEILALRWQDINFEYKEIFINKSMKSSKNGFVLSDTKTKSSLRKMPISNTVNKVLQIVLRKQAQDKELLGPEYIDNGFVCAKADGSSYSPSSFNKAFANMLKKIDFPHIRIHDLRHTYVSIMRRMGVSTKTVGELCGHVNFGEITDKIYTHVNQNDKIEAAALMDNQLKFFLKIRVRDKKRDRFDKRV